jgi:hypothetical protein
MSPPPDRSVRLTWLAMAGLAVGLGAGPLLGALLPLAPWTAAAVLVGAGPLAWLALAGEARSARLDVEQGRAPFAKGRSTRTAVTAALATLAAAVAAVHAGWGAVALARLADAGPSSVSEKGVTTWMGSDQGYLGQPGLQGTTALVLAVAGALLVVALVGARRWRGWALGLLALAVALQAAVTVALWLERGTPGVALLDLRERWTDWRSGAGDIGLGLFAGLLLSGAGFGLLNAQLRQARSATGLRRLAWLAAPSAALVGLLAAWPALGALPGAPLGAPAPYGRLAAVALLAPASSFGSMAWQATWFAGVLFAGLLGAIVASQPALHVLESALGVKPGRAAVAFAALVGLVSLLAVLLPGVLELLLGLVGLLAVVASASWVAADRPARLAPQLAVAVLLLFASVVACAIPTWSALAPLTGAWGDDALRDNAVLALLLCAALLVWWLALLALAALRARSLRPPGPGAPEPRRTRA